MSENLNDERVYASMAGIEMLVASLMRESRRRTGLNYEGFAKLVDGGGRTIPRAYFAYERGVNHPVADVFLRALEAGGCPIVGFLAEWLYRAGAPPVVAEAPAVEDVEE